MSEQKKPVAVLGMSGGVDSSVAVHLLQEQGYDVRGVHMLMIPKRYCVNENAADDARAVADQYGIPFTVLDVREEFEETIIKLFSEEYRKGRTPNPCVYCNRALKFGLFAEKAMEMGADFLSTGHYVRIGYSQTYGKRLLLKAVDSKKDQSYFLSLINPAVLDRCVFPLGDYTKDQVREIAREIGLKVAEKHDSQEICFIPDNDYKSFLKNYLPKGSFRSGKVYHTDGRCLGTHTGIPNYTIGQRKGLGIALGEPAYVVGMDIAENRVLLGPAAELMHNYLTASQTGLFVDLPKETPIPIQAKIRYRAKAGNAILILHDDGMSEVRFEEAQRAITAGQCVSYFDGDVLLGGGIIETMKTV